MASVQGWDTGSSDSPPPEQLGCEQSDNFLRAAWDSQAARSVSKASAVKC